MMFVRIVLCSCMLFFWQPEAQATATQVARQVVDQLMNREGARAKQTLILLQKDYPNYPLLGFMKITPQWAKAEGTYDKAVRLQTLQHILSLLTQSITLAKSQLVEHPDNAEWKLNLGLSQAFTGLVYMRQSKWLDAYQFGLAGRDTLRSLVKEKPHMEDAYIVLGFYEYYTGSVPVYLSWLSWLVDLSGNKELGLQYIHRAIEHAPILSPEASRMLLAQTKTDKTNACQKLPLTQKMGREYPRNELFPWLEKQIRPLCNLKKQS